MEVGPKLSSAGETMKLTARLLSFFLLCVAVLLLLPGTCLAQKAGLVMCAPGGEVSLYSSMITLEIAATLKCGEPVTVLGRYDNFYQVRTDKGQSGFLPAESVRFVKGAPGASASATRQKGKQGTASARNGNGAPAQTASAPAPPARMAPASVVLARQTAVHLKFAQTVSSADAKAGAEVNFEVTQDVVANGYTVIPKGAIGVGEVTQVEPKRRMGRGGKLSVSVKYVQLGNKEQVPLHLIQEGQSADQKVGKVVPFMRGKDVTLDKGTEVTAYVVGDVKVKTANLVLAQKN
jgi:hypothetical protein